MQERSPLAQPFDQRAFRNAMGRFTTGVTVITTAVDDEVFGMTANGFMSVSLDPPLIVASIARKARMHAALTRSGRYGVSVLCEDQEHLSGHFAGRPVEDLVPDFEWSESIPVLRRSLAQVVAEVTDVHEAGDHSLWIGRVLHFVVRDAVAPLVFHEGKYRGLLEMRPDYGDAWSGFALDPHVP